MKCYFLNNTLLDFIIFISEKIYQWIYFKTNLNNYLAGRVMEPYKCKPTPRPGAAKYGWFTENNFGLYNLNSFPGIGNLSTKMKEILISSANNNLAKQSWKTYKTVGNHVIKAQEATGVQMDFPMTQPMILAFIAYLMKERKIKANSINQYLSGLRTLHLKRGLEVPLLRPNIVNVIINGRGHYDEEMARHDFNNRRLPVTMEILKMLKILLPKQG